MLYPVPGSSRHEALCQCREVPGRAVGVNSSGVLREQPPLQVLGADGGQPAVPGVLIIRFSSTRCQRRSRITGPAAG